MGVRICVLAVVLGVCCAANAASALADAISTPTVVGGTPQSDKPMQFSFTGSADVSGTWLEVLVRPTGPIACQATFDNDQAAVPGSATIYNRSYTVGPGPFTAAATYTPSTGSTVPRSFVACVWLMRPGGTPPAGTTTAGPVTLTFAVNPPPPPPPASHQFNGSGILTRPAVGVDTAGDRFIFWQGGDHRLWESDDVSSGENVVRIDRAGKIDSAPALAVHRNGEQDVFWKGGDGRLWEAWWTGSWHGGVDLKTPKLFSDPTAGLDSAGREWVFWRGAKNSLWGMRYSGKVWGHPFSVSGAGTLTSDPGVAVNPDGNAVVVFYRGGDRGLWAETFTGKRWVKSKLGNGPLGSAPTAGADRSGNLYVFWRGTHGGLWEATRHSGTWRAASQLDFAGTLGTPPGATVEANGAQHVFWGGSDQTLWGIEYENGHW
ncbi:MAG: hypothetical protein ACJ780_05115 [Solirubrobacteraceae bacterium]